MLSLPNNCWHLLFIIRINKISESTKERKIFIFQHFSFYVDIDIEDLFDVE